MQDSARSIADGARAAKRCKADGEGAGAIERRSLREGGWADSAGGPPKTPKVNERLSGSHLSTVRADAGGFDASSGASSRAPSASKQSMMWCAAPTTVCCHAGARAGRGAGGRR